MLTAFLLQSQLVLLLCFLLSCIMQIIPQILILQVVAFSSVDVEELPNVIVLSLKYLFLYFEWSPFRFYTTCQGACLASCYFFYACLLYLCFTVFLSLHTSHWAIHLLFASIFNMAHVAANTFDQAWWN